MELSYWYLIWHPRPLGLARTTLATSKSSKFLSTAFSAPLSPFYRGRNGDSCPTKLSHRCGWQSLGGHPRPGSLEGAGGQNQDGLAPPPPPHGGLWALDWQMQDLISFLPRASGKESCHEEGERELPLPTAVRTSVSSSVKWGNNTPYCIVLRMNQEHVPWGVGGGRGME